MPFWKKDKKEAKLKHSHQPQPVDAKSPARHISLPGERRYTVEASDRERIRPNSTSPNSSQNRHITITTRVGSVTNKSHSLNRSDSGKKVAQTKAFYEELSKQGTASTSNNSTLTRSGQFSPEKRRQGTNVSVESSSTSSSHVSVNVTSPTPLTDGSGSGSRTPVVLRASRIGGGGSPDLSNLSPMTSARINKRTSLIFDGTTSPDISREKSFDGVDLPLPPLQMANIRLREVEAGRNAPGGGFGFILRKSYLPVPEDPEKTKLVHLVEPRSDYLGPLMTGDRIIEVNGENVEDSPHEEVVEMIKSSGGSVSLKVASMPELTELNARGALDGVEESGSSLKRNSKFRKSGKGKAQHKTGTLGRKKNKPDFKAKTEAEVISEREGLEQEKIWVIHKSGFTLGTITRDSPKRNTQYTSYSLVRSQHQVKIAATGEVIEVSDDDIEKANPTQYDKVEDLVKLVHLNESSVLHVLRQRYSSSLIHTFAGRHLIVLNPLRPLSSYVDRVIDMFRGCRREDMPPHIFAMGQQAYRDMMITRQDQSLILMGLSGSGKTFNARYLLRYLTTIGQPEFGPVTNAKLDAVELLLHSFGSAATFLNPQATRCACLYSLDFDPSGTVISAVVRTFLLEKYRVAHRPNGEGNFNIFYQLFAGADEQLRQDLMLFVPSEIDEPNLYFEPVEDEQRVDSAAYVWELIQNCLDILEISEEEAQGLWALLAAIYHLGNANVKKAPVRGSDCFLNPAAAQRAATILGIDLEALGRDIFTPPRSASTRLSNVFNSSPSSQSVSDTTSIGSSLFLTNVGGSRTAFLDAFVMGLYDQAFNALVMLINRALQAPLTNNKRQSSVHVIDMPGFQHRELAGARDGASFDDLCMNYAQERLQMLFHDSTFTSEQDRYMQEEIDWNVLSEVAPSPLPLIDTIDKHVPQRRGVQLDFHTDRRGILWIMDEESVFPGASDSSFLDRVHLYHESKSSMDWGDSPLVKVIKDDNQFTLYHCQRTLPVLYDANGWVWRAREHPSFRVVVQVMAESKRPSIASIFQGRGVAASATTIGSSQLKADTHHRTIARTTSTQSGGIHFQNPSSGVKKSSVCLQTKFQVDFLIDLLRKSKQWFIRCILPQLPHKLPGALPSPDPALQNREDTGDESAARGYVNVPLVRDQLKRAELVKAARIYKLGFPEFVSYPEFRRLYGALLPPDVGNQSMSDKEKAEFILTCAAVEKSTYRLGLSRVFFRARTLAKLDRQVEDTTHDTIVQFQTRCRGWLARQRFVKRKLQESAALVIQQNVLSWLELREFSWWKLFLQVKPMLAIWRAEEDIKDRDEKITKLKNKVESLEKERDDMKDLEAQLESKVTQLSAQLEDVLSSANEASDLMENEQMEKRELEEKLNEASSHASALSRENEQLKLQVAEMTIIARIKQSGEDGQESSEAVLEKYYEAKRELETLKQRVSSEYEDEIERLTATKKSLDKKLADSEGEIEDLHKSLSQSRKKVAKLGQEMNDLKLHLEEQQGRNAELEKRQRKFDADLNAAKDESSSEVQAKAKLAREKEQLQNEISELKEKVKVLEEENKQMRQEKEDLESEVLSHTSKTAESEITSLKRMKRDMDLKIEELEDELDEVNLKLDTLQQSKARLELSNQTLKQQHQKELEGREEEVEQVRTAMNKKLKSLNQQLEEMHEEKQAAVKARRDMERDLIEFQSKMSNPEMEKKLRKQVKKFKALWEDSQAELERLKDSRGSSAIVKSLRNQLEDLQASETSANKAQKRLQAEIDEMMIQNDELSRNKIELEGRVSDLVREKEDMEARLEDDQDEIEELLEKQRAHISHTSSLQAQLNEATIQIGELEEGKISLESKVDELASKISELESGVNRHQYEASELKVKELEQKLELERSTARRHEAQIHRLRNQLERAQEEKSEDVSHKNSDALRRMQKQLRELRNDLQEAERKEQDALKKKRNAEARVEELEAQLESGKADLKSAQKRIDTLHSALKGHEDFSGDDTREFDDTYMDDDDDDLSSNASSYKIGEYDDLDDDDDDLSGLSDDESGGLHLDVPSSSRSRTWERSTRSKSRELSPIIDEDEFSSSYGSRRRNRSGGSDELKSRSKRVEDNSAPTSSSRRQRDTADLDDDLPSSRRRRNKELEDDDDDDLKVTSSRTGRKASPRFGDDLDEPRARSGSKNSLDDKDTTSRKSKISSKLDNDDDSDDADLEELLKKQRERMKSLRDDDDDYKAASSVRRPSTGGASAKLSDDDASPKRSRKKSEDSSSPLTSPRHVNGTSKKGNDSREGSEEPTEDSHTSSKQKQNRRRRQRQRTIELLTSPEHQAIKSNGVK